MYRPRFWSLRFMLILGSLLFVNLGGAVPNTTATATKLQVVATIQPVADWVRQVGGPAVDVTVLVPPGRSPHTFEPSPGDLRRIARCHLFVSVGLGLDDWTIRLGKTASGAARLALGERLKERGVLPTDLAGDPTTSDTTAHTNHAHTGEHHDHSHCDHEHGPDPHFWLDPLLAREAVSEIAHVLAKVAPEGAAMWSERAEAYRGELQRLHAEIAAELEPCRGKSLVTFHGAFAYFARRYNLTIGGVIQEFPGKQPSERYLKNLARLLREAQTTTIFAEPQQDPRISEILAREIGARVSTLDPEGTAERTTYVELMRFNAQQIRKNLCPPEKAEGSAARRP